MFIRGCLADVSHNSDSKIIDVLYCCDYINGQVEKFGIDEFLSNCDFKNINAVKKYLLEKTRANK